MWKVSTTVLQWYTMALSRHTIRYLGGQWSNGWKKVSTYTNIHHKKSRFYQPSPWPSS